MNVLSKRIVDLTKEEREGLRKVLGVPGRPYPMMKPPYQKSGGKQDDGDQLGVLEDSDYPLVVYSEQPYDRVMGLAYREMPTPSMLTMFRDDLLLRDPASRRRVRFIKGDPGAGKSYMAKLEARMRSPRGAIVVDCGGKNLSELLYETVLDFNRDKTFYRELDQRLQSGTANPATLSLLEEALGHAFVRGANGMAAVDWELVGDALPDAVRDADATLQELELRKGRDRRLQRAVKALQQASALEGLSHLVGNTLGMATQEGPLIRAMREGRELVLDEYNKSKEGTDDSLQTVLQFLTGEIDECTVENKLKEKGDLASQFFTFRREDVKAGFFVSLTGNAIEDGVTTRRLSKSVYSRLDPVTVPWPTLDDWQHRLCQILTGLPLSTLYRMKENYWEEHPKAFTERLLDLRRLGMTQEEQAAIPQHQIQLLKHWPEVLEATEQLARFYKGWSELTNPDSKLLNSPGYADVVLEVDEDYHAEVCIDFRKIIRHLDEAFPVQAEVTSSVFGEEMDLGSWSEPPRLPPRVEEDPEINFGSRLVQIILSKVNATTVDVGKRALHRHLMQLAADCSLRTADLKEGTPSQQKPVAELLNLNPYDDADPKQQVRLAQHLLGEYLRHRFPGEVEGRDDEIVTRPQMAFALLAGAEVVRKLDTGHNLMVLPNPNMDTLSEQPLVMVKTHDATPTAGEDEPTAEPPVASLCDLETLLTSFRLPVVGEKNVAACWNEALIASGATSALEDGEVDEALAMAVGQSISGLATTSVMVRQGEGDEAKAVPLHIFRDEVSGRTLIISEGVERGQVKALRLKGITLVDRGGSMASFRLECALGDFLSGRSAEVKTALKDAFLLRNAVAGVGDAEEGKMTLDEILASPQMECVLPHYVPDPQQAALVLPPPSIKREAPHVAG